MWILASFTLKLLSWFFCSVQDVVLKTFFIIIYILKYSDYILQHSQMQRKFFIHNMQS